MLESRSGKREFFVEITGLSELVFPEHGCRNLERLKVNRLSSLKSLVIEDEAFEGREVLEVSSMNKKQR